MFSSLDHFKTIWESEKQSTLSCLEKLTDESLDKELVPGFRSIGRLATHIVDSAASIAQHAGLPVSYDKKPYPDVKTIIEEYKINTAKVEEALAVWSDDTLQEDVIMYGENWKRGFGLWVLFVHQAHHRGQLTILMRLAGLKVPGVYGPAKEEWEAFGLPKAD